MTTATTSAATNLPSSDVPAAPLHPEQTLYAASGLRKTLISFLFLLMLPFFASLPAMIGMRVTRGLWADAAGLSLLALAFAVVMFLLLINLIFSLRARVQLGEKHVRLTLPSGRGPTPMLRYRTEELAYDDIAAVETRREIYGGVLAPVMLLGARLIKKDGSIVKLGYESEANQSSAFPYVEIAHQIARRAGLPVKNQGSVRRTLASKTLGIASLQADASPIDDAEIARLNTLHRRFVIGLVLLLTGLVIAGMTIDVLKPPSSASAVLEGSPKKPR